MSRYVVALGGNALNAQAIKKAAGVIAKIHLKGNDVVVTHGNGPQVGELEDEQHRNLSILTAETEAWIGSVLAEGISNALTDRKRKSAYKAVGTVLTRIIVDAHSPEFRHPSKPIGRFLTKAEAQAYSKKGMATTKMIGGYRRVVPSPEPREIMELDVIEDMLREGKVAIACGGGGTAVVRKGLRTEYADAVIDKDRASALLASRINADKFFILTDVDGAYLDYKKKGQRLIRKASTSKLKNYIKEGQFEDGSMKPKVESCIRFAAASGNAAAIGNIGKAADVIALKSGTLITP